MNVLTRQKAVLLINIRDPRSCAIPLKTRLFGDRLDLSRGRSSSDATSGTFKRRERGYILGSFLHFNLIFLTCTRWIAVFERINVVGKLHFLCSRGFLKSCWLPATSPVILVHILRGIVSRHYARKKKRKCAALMRERSLSCDASSNLLLLTPLGVILLRRKWFSATAVATGNWEENFPW